MTTRSRRSVLVIIAVGLATTTAMHSARAGNSLSPFGVEFSDCVESIGVGLAPTPNVLALTPPGFVPVGVGMDFSPIVVRTANCAGIAVDDHKPKAGSVVQIGAVIVPPEIGLGDINNYTFWYYTTDEKLAHRLRDLGVSAQHVETIGYMLEPEAIGCSERPYGHGSQAWRASLYARRLRPSFRYADRPVRCGLVAEDVRRQYSNEHQRAGDCHQFGLADSRN